MASKHTLTINKRRMARTCTDTQAQMFTGPCTHTGTTQTNTYARARVHAYAGRTHMHRHARTDIVRDTHARAEIARDAHRGTEMFEAMLVDDVIQNARQ